MHECGALAELCSQGKTRIAWKKTYPGATLFITDPTWTDLVSNSCFRDEKTL